MTPRTRIGLALAGILGLLLALRQKDQRPKLREVTTRPRAFSFWRWLFCTHADQQRYPLGGSVCRGCGVAIGEADQDSVGVDRERFRVVDRRGRA
jgi:hypothetical protein